ncbi:TetR/AcrR family transcriptional regulator [Frankia sp. CN7]|uniref:TetR/AcrR family transcriptional regulator n=1 Tax=Frankia nepalensis TaxID=1836974 RepID=UPI00193135C9|nr:TetR/AcrR family transcriptional regulator [Frankia nepalensis]MBL7496487.1 TetR/AcrR family transcriptional regulator [Frankia nepalensis]
MATTSTTSTSTAAKAPRRVTRIRRPPSSIVRPAVPAAPPVRAAWNAAQPARSGAGAAAAAPLSPREVRRQERLRLGREQILDAAEELFGRQGYRGTSLQQVAKRCEFSIGALYLFIDSKEELLRAVLGRRTAELMAKMTECLAAEGTGAQLLARLARMQVDFHRRYPDFGRLSTQIMSATGMPGMPGFGEDVARGYDAAIALEAELFARGQRDGTLRAGDPECLARLYSAMVTAYHAMDPEVTGTGVGAGLPDEVFLSTVSAAFAP